MVGENIWTTDVEGLPKDLIMLKAPLEIVEDIAYGDGLNRCPDPPRRCHDRKAFYEVTQYLKGGTP
jgi:hypothetical protein